MESLYITEERDEERHITLLYGRGKLIGGVKDDAQEPGEVRKRVNGHACAILQLSEANRSLTLRPSSVFFE